MECKEVLNDLSAGKTLVLFSQKMADEGSDVPILSRIFLTCPARNTNGTTQRIGRIKRPHVSKAAPIVYDYLDTRIGLAVSQFKTRRAKVYDRYPIEFIRTEKQDDGTI